jgi:hypothetical protein
MLEIDGNLCCMYAEAVSVKRYAQDESCAFVVYHSR